MSLIQEIWLIVETKKVKNAETDSKHLELEIKTQGQVVKRKLRDLPGDNLEPNRADIWHFDLSDEQIQFTKLKPGSFRLTNGSKDGWLPKSIFIVGKINSGEFKILLANPSWPDKWFDSDGGSDQQSSTSWPLDET